MMTYSEKKKTETETAKDNLWKVCCVYTEMGTME